MKQELSKGGAGTLKGTDAPFGRTQTNDESPTIQSGSSQESTAKVYRLYAKPGFQPRKYRFPCGSESPSA
ncbi:MAG: hypothetical protein ACK53L_13260, partial [Pirellulaceae bacterium]